MAQTYFVGNFAIPTTAAPVAVATGTSIKTLLQIATPSTAEVKIIEWGISFDGNAAATPGKIELFGTTVAATSGTSITPQTFANVNGPASLCVGGTGATCFSPSVEGTVANYRPLDVQFIMGTNQYVKQFPLGREPMIAISQFVRVRVTFGASVNAYTYIIWEE
jgi:hypothetical protein